MNILGWFKKRPWQDWVLTIGGFIFAPSLVFSIADGVIMPISTSLPTALVLTAYLTVYVSLRLWMSLFATSLTALCWYILFFMAI